ncbi:hypothetical protein FCM35_KLT02689 [Carex littledalei]|uniref:Uncharacterized protein n=1 Tax=Carex littledalei TaxID=544730 RepID=A0A833R8T0_9POAL|nr:hypothetical protein FCM35_KLT02689 [Carex littledalei]
MMNVQWESAKSIPEVEAPEEAGSSSQMPHDELTDESCSLELPKVSKEDIKQMILELNNLRIEAHLGLDDSLSHLLSDENDTGSDRLSPLAKHIVEKISSVGNPSSHDRVSEILK